MPFESEKGYGPHSDNPVSRDLAQRIARRNAFPVRCGVATERAAWYIPVMKRHLILLALIFAAAALAKSPQAPKQRRIPCKTEENAKTCYWTHGRLSFTNGTPSVRLWKIGTSRILGIYSGPSSGPFDDGIVDDEDVELPPNLMKHDFTKSSVFADFEVCPLAPEKDGHMQPACIESAKRIVSGDAR